MLQEPVLITDPNFNKTVIANGQTRKFHTYKICRADVEKVSDTEILELCIRHALQSANNAETFFFILW